MIDQQFINFFACQGADRPATLVHHGCPAETEQRTPLLNLQLKIYLKFFRGLDDLSIDSRTSKQSFLRELLMKRQEDC